jgi:hypothetical protein
MSEQGEIRSSPPGKGTFGFEFELLIPFTAGGSYKEIRKPKSVKKAVVRNERLGFTLKLDEQSKMSIFRPVSFIQQVTAFTRAPVNVAWVGENMTIPEIVTDVLTSEISPEELSKRIGAIAGWAADLVAKAKKNRKSLQELDHELKPVTDDSRVAVEGLAGLHLGPIVHPTGVNPATVDQANNAIADITASAYVHQTYALPLDKVLDELSYLAGLCKGTEAFASPLKKAADPGPVTTALSKLDLASDPAAAQLGGFFALLRYYAIALSVPNQTGGLGKNNSALVLFYKTSLANVRAKLVQDHASLMSSLALALENSNKKAGALLALGTDVGDPGWKGYLNGLVNGTGQDHVIEKFKNEYSGELSPGDGALGVVVENRRLAELAPSADGKRYAPDEWVGLAETLRKRLTGYWPKG